MNNPNGCTGLNCPFQHNKIIQCDLTDCPYRDRPPCFTPVNRTEECAIEEAFRIGLQQGLLMACEYADPTPVVRCRDCVYSREYDVANPGYTLVCLHNGTSRQVWSKDYCSYGRRRASKRANNPEKG